MQLHKIKNTYDLLIFILNNNNKNLKYEDIYYNTHKKHCVTFGDVLINKDGEKIPKEKILTMKEE